MCLSEQSAGFALFNELFQYMYMIIPYKNSIQYFWAAIISLGTCTFFIIVIFSSGVGGSAHTEIDLNKVDLTTSCLTPKRTTACEKTVPIPAQCTGKCGCIHIFSLQQNTSFKLYKSKSLICFVFN